MLEAFLGVYRELARRKSEASATPEEARRANTAQRLQLRERNAYLPEIEAVAGEMLRTVGHRGGALTHSSVSKMARHLGFEIIHVGDLPHSARSVIDLANGRIGRASCRERV